MKLDMRRLQAVQADPKVELYNLTDIRLNRLLGEDKVVLLAMSIWARAADMPPPSS